MAKIIKIIVIIAFGAVCLMTASNFSESYAAEVSAKEQTLAEAVMKSQLEAEIKKAEEQAAKELEEQGQTLVTEVLETKPPVTTTTTVTTTETETETTTVTETETTTVPTEGSVSETVTTEEKIITEFTRGGLLPTDRTGIPNRSMFALAESEQKLVVNYLIEHYFLDGYKYSAAETRPALKEKKQLAAEMEGNVVKTINMIFASVSMSDIAAMLTADYGNMKSEVTAIRDDFEKKYSDAASYGKEFGELYEDSLKYFDRLIQAIEKIENTANQYKNTTNPLLVLSLIATSLDDVIIPEVMGVLEQSFDLVEASQVIFLEGTQGKQLLTRDEVRDIIKNPGLALYVELN